MNTKQIERLKAKERSFVLKLTHKDIILILEKCGYALNETLFNEQTSKRLPAITKFYNEQLKEYQIQIRCIKKIVWLTK